MWAGRAKVHVDLSIERFILELCHAIWAMQGIYSAYVSWNGKIAKQFVKTTVKITSSMTQATGSTSKMNISNQAIHALLRNGQCNEDMAARTKLYKMVCLNIGHDFIVKMLFRSTTLKTSENCLNIC